MFSLREVAEDQFVYRCHGCGISVNLINLAHSSRVKRLATGQRSRLPQVEMLIEAGTGTRDELMKVRDGSGLGLFVRSLVGMDREAAKRSFDGFLAGKTLTANQIQFVNLVIDSLTQSGWMEIRQLYETPFTDFSPRGVDGIFNPEQVIQLIGVLEHIRMSASV